MLYIISTDQESCTVILCKTGYNNKVNGLIEDGIINGKYVETTDSKHKEWKIFQDFLYRDFYHKEYFDEMRPISKQPNCFFTRAKIHKLEDFEKINTGNLKLRPIVKQSGTYIYYRSKVVENYPNPCVYCRKL